MNHRPVQTFRGRLVGGGALGAYSTALTWRGQGVGGGALGAYSTALTWRDQPELLERWALTAPR